MKQHSRILILFALCALSVLTGCSTPMSSQFDPKVVPDNFELSLAMYDTQGKRTYFVLDKQGELSFAGGREASLRTPSPVLTLTPQQRGEIWSLIITSQMLETPNQMFKSPEKVAYDVEIKAGKSANSKAFHVTDQSVPPAVIQLHDLLFKLQADERYQPSLPASDSSKP